MTQNENKDSKPLYRLKGTEHYQVCFSYTLLSYSNSTDTCCAHRLAENLQRAFKHHGVHSSGSASVGELPDSVFYTEYSSCIQKHGYNHCCILRWFDNNRYDDGLCRCHQ